MYITKVRIRNFRGLEDIEFDPKPGINTIVGPNAVGKTSVLEAIRLNKAFLLPRFQEELSQTLIALGAATPHIMFGPFQFDLGAIAGDVSKRLEITLDFTFSDEEVNRIQALVPSIAQGLIRSKLGQERNTVQHNFIQYLSSPVGQESFAQSVDEVSKSLQRLPTLKMLTSSLVIEQQGQNINIRGRDVIAQLAISTFESTCHPSQALVSYFPADRALPSGEVNIQIGSNDMKAQVDSHLATPANKYARLKQTIVNNLILSQTHGLDIKKNFDVLFSQLLPGKSLTSINQRPTGNLGVMIKDEVSQRQFDIDSLSSGEKGLILTFLLLQGSCANGGIVLLDEPELHLNPAVCKKIVPFLIEQFVTPARLQFFMCSHSAEILSSAFNREDCAIFHLRTSKDITPVAHRDKSELFEILRRLGLSTMDVLSWTGTIFVEGEHDSDLINIGFPDVIPGYQVKELGGRAEIEKDVQRLQEAEKNGGTDRLNLFIFDNDRKPTNLISTPLVRVAQWERYCLENYLLDESILFDVIGRYTKSAPKSKGELKQALKELALSQITDIVAKEAYAPREPENCGVRPRELAHKNYSDIAKILFDRIDSVKNKIEPLDRQKWEKEFSGACAALDRKYRDEWDDTWRKKANGKQILKDVQQKYQVNASLAQVKTDIVREMRLAKTDDWRLIESFLAQHLKRTS